MRFAAVQCAIYHVLSLAISLILCNKTSWQKRESACRNIPLWSGQEPAISGHLCVLSSSLSLIDKQTLRQLRVRYIASELQLLGSGI